MKLFEFFDKIGKNNTAVLIYCLLNRIPIIICGKDAENVNDLIIEISQLIPFRKDFVFGTDFISEKEYSTLRNIEKIDFNSLRTQISCPTCVSSEILKNFNSIGSMIIGIKLIEELQFNVTIDSLNKFNTAFCLFNLVSKDKKIKIYGIKCKNIQIDLELKILKKISDDTKKSIIRMKRVLSEKIKQKNLDLDLLTTLLDFRNEKIELQRNILRKEIQNFYSGCKRAFFILSRLDLLKNLNFDTKIGFNTLKETIDFHDVSLERIILFIKKEWGEDYSNLIEKDRMINLSDKIQSLWG
ncbi:MAG: hypothetical protein P8Y70_13020 [Candidatus Lokiarchaeota archaeon]